MGGPVEPNGAPDYAGCLSNPIGRTNFVDHSCRPVFQDERGQYVVDAGGEKVYGVWLLTDDAEVPVVVSADGTILADAEELVAAHRHTKKNRAEVQAGALCGCISCLATFLPKAVSDWLDVDLGILEGEDGGIEIDPTTACCPKCDMDAVLGSASGYPLTREFLRQMQLHWFPEAAADED